TGQNPTHVYTNPSPGSVSWTVSLTVTTAHGTDTETKANYIRTFTVPPTADFTASNTTPRVDEVVQFNDASAPGTAPITSWLWNFGDGATSTSPNPAHTFVLRPPRSYTISLTVTTAHGTDTETKTNFIVSRIQAPDADFFAVPTTQLVNEPIQFTDATISGTAPVTSRLWNFGDGNTSILEDPEHTYLQPGFYTVSLTVNSADGSNTETKTDYITITANPPIAAFEFRRVGSTREFDFIDRSTPGSAPQIDSWLWNFGDGTPTTNVQNPSHVFPVFGSFEVTLTVTTIYESDSVTQTVTVDPRPPTADFRVSNLKPFLGDEVVFTSTSDPGTAAIETYVWEIFQYEVASPTENCASVRLQDNCGNVGPLDWPYKWRRKNITRVENLSSFTHVFAAPGNWHVWLLVKTIYGTDTINVTDIQANGFCNPDGSAEPEPPCRPPEPDPYIEVVPKPPIAAFTATPLRVFVGDPVAFDASNSNLGSATTANFNWSFGDGTTDSGETVTHVFAAPGLYDVGLTVSTAFGFDTEVKVQYIEVIAPTPLDVYVHSIVTGDPYRHSLFTTLYGPDEDDLFGPDYTGFVLSLTSQAWRTTSGSEDWNHWVTVIKPARVTNNTALLYIDDGDSGGLAGTDPAPASIDTDLAEFAKQTGSVVVQLREVPNQPGAFPGDATVIREHELVAASFDRFLDTFGTPAEDPGHLVLLPMVRSVKRAMDATQEFLRNRRVGDTPVGPVVIKDFVVSGADIRAWAAWLTAAADGRIVGVLPLAFEFLNLPAQVDHQFAAYNGFTPALQPYEDRNVFGRLNSLAGRSLVDIIDPIRDQYVSRSGMRAPKLMINASGDEVYVPDAAQFYFSRLQGPKHFRYLPNTDHQLRGPDPIGSDRYKPSLLELGQMWYSTIVLADNALPEFGFELIQGEFFQIDVNPAGNDPGEPEILFQAEPSRVTLWEAVATDAQGRDFRLENLGGTAWKSSDVEFEGTEGPIAVINTPDDGWRAFFVELVYTSLDGETEIKFTTDLEVVPPELPFGAKIAIKE
ncbi:MAG: PKD domain-containing protein, partial [Candidatus Hydrogenedentes bacterium]|nr:PKD domain-containing protein [Candidatus Hydrogenedentota bacterium]